MSDIHRPFAQAMFHVDRIIDETLLATLLTRLTSNHPVLESFPHYSVWKGDRQLTCDILQKAREEAGPEKAFATALILSEHESWIILTLSAYTGDAISLDILKQELLNGLAGIAASPEELSYAQFSQWQDTLEKDADEIAFWDNYPLDGQKHFRFYTAPDTITPIPAFYTLHITPDLQEKMKQSFRGWEEEIFLSSWLAVLAKHNDDLPVSIGYVTGSRSFPELTTLVGPLARTLPLTFRPEGRLDFRENTHLLKTGMEQVLTHQYAFHQTAGTAGLPTAFQYLATGSTADEHTEIELLIDSREYHALKLTIVEDTLLQFSYDPACYPPAAIKAIGFQFLSMLEHALTDSPTPWDHIHIKTSRDNAIVTPLEPAHRNLVEALDNIIARQAAALAMTCNEKEWSYSSIGAQSDILANVLMTDHGIRPGDRVGLLMDPTEPLLPVLAGILKTGVAYVPLDPGRPISEIEYMIRDSACKIVLGDEASIHLPIQTPVRLLAIQEMIRDRTGKVTLPEYGNDAEACILYPPQSGTMPQGIVITHRTLLDHAAWMKDTLAIKTQDAFALMDVRHADPACIDRLSIFLNGATLHIIPAYLERIREVLTRYLMTRKLDRLHTSPSLLRQLLEGSDTGMSRLLPDIKLIYMKGERPDAALAQQIWTMNPICRIVHAYQLNGSTLYHAFDPQRITYYRSHPVPLLPITGYEIGILDALQEPCAPGITGELFMKYPEKRDIYGTGQRGYWNAFGELELIQSPGTTTQVGTEDPDETQQALQELVRSVWQDVLHRDDIAGQDNFFQLGGDSIKAMQISARLHARGYLIQAMEIFNYPTITSLARAIRPADIPISQVAFEAEFPMPPIYQYLFEHIKYAPHHHNQSIMLDLSDTALADLDKAVEKIIATHDILRLTMRKNPEGEWVPFIRPPGFKPTIGYSEIEPGQKGWKEVGRITNELQAGFDLFSRPLIQLHFFKTGQDNFLFIVMHHLLTDLVSWNILVDDLNTLLDLQRKGQPLVIPAGTGSFGHWATFLAAYAREPHIQDQYAYWSQIPNKVPFPTDRPDGANYVRNLQTCSFMLDKETTTQLIARSGPDGRPGIQACVLTALGLGLKQVLGISELLIMMESHGRQLITPTLNIHRTMGWFTALFPFLLRVENAQVEDDLEEVAAQLRDIPGDGIGYGLLRYGSRKDDDQLRHQPNIMFNYLGNQRGGGGGQSNRLVKIVDRQSGFPEDKNEKRVYEMDVISAIHNGQFNLNLSYSYEQFDSQKIMACVDAIKEALKRIVRTHVGSLEISSPELTSGSLTPEDIANFFD